MIYDIVTNPRFLGAATAAAAMYAFCKGGSPFGAATGLGAGGAIATILALQRGAEAIVAPFLDGGKALISALKGVVDGLGLGGMFGGIFEWLTSVLEGAKRFVGPAVLFLMAYMVLRALR
tara:strand:+ start:794 stop:1153 length:360 start_codon:yes stop_codon:yes gene_type:complete